MGSIVTKSGDKGETSLCTGQRVQKDDLRIEALGAIDELNAHLGLVLASNSSFQSELEQIQKDLFAMSAEVAGFQHAPLRRSKSIIEQKNYSRQEIGGRKMASVADISELEAIVEKLEKKLPHLTHFILPKGNEVMARMHTARAVCRKAERRICSLVRDGLVRREIQIYLNRLSDVLFLMARSEGAKAGLNEQKW